MIKPKKIVIIGGNASGPAAAAQARRVNPESEIIMIESSPYISTGTCEIPYVLSGEITDYERIIYFDEKSFFRKKGVRVFTNHTVVSVNKKLKFVQIQNNETGGIIQQEYDTLVFATGSKPIIPEQFTQKASNVFTLKTISDLKSVLDLIANKNVNSALIIGGGYIGVEASEALRKKNIDVTILSKSDFPMNKAESEIRSFILNEINKNAVRYIGNSNYRIFYENERVKSVNVDGRLIEPELILIATGFKPETALAEECGLIIGKGGGIRTDRKMKTSDQFIYAAGDCAEVTNAVTMKPQVIPLATIARKSAYVAGENAAGGNIYSNAFVPNIAVKIFRWYYVSVGITTMQASSEGLSYSEVSGTQPNLVKVMPDSIEVFGKLIFEKETRRVLGASFWGGKETAGYGDIVSVLIRNKLSVDVLNDADFNYTPPLSPFNHLLNKLAYKTRNSSKY